MTGPVFAPAHMPPCAWCEHYREPEPSLTDPGEPMCLLDHEARGEGQEFWSSQCPDWAQYAEGMELVNILVGAIGRIRHQDRRQTIAADIADVLTPYYDWLHVHQFAQRVERAAGAVTLHE